MVIIENNKKFKIMEDGAYYYFNTHTQEYEYGTKKDCEKYASFEIEDKAERLAIENFPYTDEGSLEDCIDSAKRKIWIDGYKTKEKEYLCSKDDIGKFSKECFREIYNTKFLNIPKHHELLHIISRVLILKEYKNKNYIELDTERKIDVNNNTFESLKTYRDKSGQLMASIKK